MKLLTIAATFLLSSLATADDPAYPYCRCDKNGDVADVRVTHTACDHFYYTDGGRYHDKSTYYPVNGCYNIGTGFVEVFADQCKVYPQYATGATCCADEQTCKSR
ncbi:hypothetical protein AC579_6059 [Pseudocercospora musae]|uniref:Uncharacterized protein n=1 Tax=Pseudocercospora musae TaxID=113226 RepID=A0A139HZP0_9PEZI|nr:hypothetical protein AC579_6059 [Pseudocercospora musae]KXT07945.1 hypothetical protein AC579_6059 [Pseudocercospora musae]